MQIRAFQHTWHGVRLHDLTNGEGATPAGPDVYKRLYQTLADGKSLPDQTWSTKKRALGEFISVEIFKGWEARNLCSPRILALCAGKCAAERVWLEQNYNVTIHEYQTVSLQDVRTEFPNVPVLIGDVRELSIEETFDIVVLLAGEYFLDRRELETVLRKVAVRLSHDGLFVMQSVSALSLTQSLKELIKKFSRRYRSSAYVFWGYWRTPSEFSKSARRAGLQMNAQYSMDFVQERLVIRRNPRMLVAWPSLYLNAALMIFEHLSRASR